MTLSEFKSMNGLIQEYLVDDRGIELATRQGRGRYMKLYHFDSFYVEITYVPCTKRIIMIRGFNNDTLLKPYLDQIDITGLL